MDILWISINIVASFLMEQSKYTINVTVGYVTTFIQNQQYHVTRSGSFNPLQNRVFTHVHNIKPRDSPNKWNKLREIFSWNIPNTYITTGNHTWYPSWRHSRYRAQYCSFFVPHTPLTPSHHSHFCGYCQSVSSVLWRKMLSRFYTQPCGGWSPSPPPPPPHSQNCLFSSPLHFSPLFQPQLPPPPSTIYPPPSTERWDISFPSLSHFRLFWNSLMVG